MRWLQGGGDPVQKFGWAHTLIAVFLSMMLLVPATQGQTALTNQEVYAALPTLRVSPSTQVPGGLSLGTVRAPVLTTGPAGFELKMYWNTIDDQTWPFTRILDALLGRACGTTPKGWSEALQTNLYASQSLTPEVEVGGNGGRSFERAASMAVGACKVDLHAQGARWHVIKATVSYTSNAAIPTTPLSQSGGIFQYRWSGSPPLAEISVADVQHALIWTKHYVGMADGAIGPYTRKAIAEWQTSKGYQATGTLTAEQTSSLVTQGLELRDSYGWSTLVDPAIGYSVGIPAKLATLNAPKRDADGWSMTAVGPVFQAVVFTVASSCSSMAEFFDALVKSASSKGEVTYKGRKDDWFVVAGNDKEFHFYSRSQCRDQGVVTSIAKIRNDQIGALSFLFTAMSNSLSLRPVLNPNAAQSSPRLVEPSFRSDLSTSARTPEPPKHEVRRPAPIGFDLDRTGKTKKIKLALSEGPELSAREVFEKVSEAVFVVEVGDRQGSAVAIAEDELLTNCHVLGSNSTGTLRQEGRQVRATLISEDTGADRCVLRSETPLRKWVRIRPFSDLKVGERVFTIGAPRGLELTIAEGLVSSKRSSEGMRFVQTSAPISPGSSGGGLFDAQGHLVGITTFILKDTQNINFAISAEEYAK